MGPISFDYVHFHSEKLSLLLGLLDGTEVDTYFEELKSCMHRIGFITTKRNSGQKILAYSKMNASLLKIRFTNRSLSL